MQTTKNTAVQAPSARIHSLDGLRGIAAFTVVTTHVLWSLYDPILAGHTFTGAGTVSAKFAGFAAFSPLRFLWSGHEAVILFFVLSGYVLSLPYLNNKIGTYRTFLTKRICRLYLPYATAITLGFTTYYLIPKTGISHLTPSADALLWKANITPKLILQHYLFIGTFPTNVLDGPIWSLVHEMRISLIYPFLAVLVLSLRWTRQILVGLICVAAGIATSAIGKHALGIDSTIDYTMTYGLMFVTGIMLAQHRSRIAQWYRELKPIHRAILFLAGFASYTYASCLSLLSHNSRLLILPEDWMALAGSTVFVIAALESPIFRKMLEVRPVSFLGRISYSLYLCHIIVLNVMVYLLHPYLPLDETVWLMIPVAILLSTGFYYLVERPAQRFGARITRSAAQPKAVLAGAGVPD